MTEGKPETHYCIRCDEPGSADEMRPLYRFPERICAASVYPEHRLFFRRRNYDFTLSLVAFSEAQERELFTRPRRRPGTAASCFFAWLSSQTMMTTATAMRAKWAARNTSEGKSRLVIRHRVSPTAIATSINPEEREPPW